METLATTEGQGVPLWGFNTWGNPGSSLTARPFTEREAPEHPSRRPLSQGANPYSDIACLEAIRLIGSNLIRGVHDPEDEHLESLMFAGMLAGIGFGNAGCHLPHGMSYAVAGLCREYQPEGWSTDHPLVPHGISVIVNSPSVFRFTGSACAERHLRAAEAMGADPYGLADEESGDLLAGQLIRMMKETGIPNGLEGVGYTREDLDALTDRAFAQKRLIDNAPCSVSRDQLKALFESSLSYW